MKTIENLLKCVLWGMYLAATVNLFIYFWWWLQNCKWDLVMYASSQIQWRTNPTLCSLTFRKWIISWSWILIESEIPIVCSFIKLTRMCLNVTLSLWEIFQDVPGSRILSRRSDSICPALAVSQYMMDSCIDKIQANAINSSLKRKKKGSNACKRRFYVERA